MCNMCNLTACAKMCNMCNKLKCAMNGRINNSEHEWQSVEQSQQKLGQTWQARNNRE